MISTAAPKSSAAWLQRPRRPFRWPRKASNWALWCGSAEAISGSIFACIETSSPSEKVRSPLRRSMNAARARAFALSRAARIARYEARAVPDASTKSTPNIARATALLPRYQRRDHRHAGSAQPTGRARIGSSARNRCRSCAKASAFSYRRTGSFSRH